MRIAKPIFCAASQTETEHELKVVRDDVIATCQECGRVLKFPANVRPDELQGLIEEHKKANMGHVPPPEESTELHPLLKALANG